MTREEALEILRQPDRIGCNLIKANDEESTKYNQESIEALTMAIKALEQEPILDKIIAEIESLTKVYPFTNHIDTYVKEDDVYKIIDKYRESEDKE